MSIPKKRTINCPQCGKEIEFTLWESINTEMSFAIPDIISGKLFTVKCEKCGYKTCVDYPILFNDMDHNVMIYYTTRDNARETEKAVELMKKLKCGRVRIVLDQNALREKIAIFNAGLDDRVTEILKLIVIMSVEDQIEGKKISSVYFLPGDDPKVEVTLEDGSGDVPVSMEMYDEIEKLFHHQLSEDESEYYIDQDWAQSFLSDHEDLLQ